MNRGHTRRSRERNTAYAPCTRVLRLYPVSLLRTIRPTDGSIESIRGRNKAATRAAHLHLLLLLLPLLLRHFPCLACFFPPRVEDGRVKGRQEVGDVVYCRRLRLDRLSFFSGRLECIRIIDCSKDLWVKMEEGRGWIVEETIARRDSLEIWRLGDVDNF